MEPMETGHPLSPRQSPSLDEQVLPTSFHCQVCHASHCHDCHVNDLPMPVSGAMGRTDAEIKEEKDLRNEVQELTRNLESCTEERDDYKDQFDALVVEFGEFRQRKEEETHQETGHPLPLRQSRSLEEDNRYVKVLPTPLHCQVGPVSDCQVNDLPMPVSGARGRTDAELKEEKDLRNEVQELTRKLESCTKERDDYKGQFDALAVDAGVSQQRTQMEPHQETGHTMPLRQSRSLDEDNRYVKVLPTSFHCQVCHVSHCHDCHVNDLPMPVSGARGRTDAELKEEKDLRNEVQELTRKLESCTKERDDYKGQFDALVVDSGVSQQRIQVFQNFVIEGTNIIFGDGNTMIVNEENLHEVLTKLVEIKGELGTSKLSLDDLTEGVKKLTKSMEEGHTQTDTIKADVRDLMELVSDRPELKLSLEELTKSMEEGHTKTDNIKADVRALMELVSNRPELKVYRECLHSLRDLKDNPRFQEGQFKFDDLPDQHAKSGVKRMAATLDESMWMQAAVRFGVNNTNIPATETDLAKRKLTIYAHLLYRWVCREPDKTEEDLIDIIEELQRERNKETRKRLEATVKPKFKPAPPRDTNQFKEVDTKLCQMVKQILDQMNRFGEGISLPEHWDPMKDSEYIKIVMLKPTDPEYQQLEKDFIGQVKNGCYPARLHFDVSTIKIDRIERVQNKHLWQQYVVRKAKIEKEKPTLPADMKPLERKVWHGTTATASTSIETHGFNRSYCGVNETWFGQGVYFASDASPSARGWLSGAQSTGHTRGCVFSVRAVTGYYTKGNPRMRFLPPIDQAKPLILFDSAVDNLQNPEVFVIFHDTQAYPEYLITFSAN